MKPLTQTEKHILDLVGQGMSSARIAFALDISSHTVETHRKSLLSKLDAKNSAEMILKAMLASVTSNDPVFNPK